MDQNSESRRIAYLTALSQEIHKKLLRAESSPSQLRNLLQELFADVALEVDDRAKDVILSRVSDAISPVEKGRENRLCFYDVLSEHFIQVPEDGQPILDLIVKLWSQSFAVHIFALLFHKWMFEVKVEDSEKLLRYCSAFVRGSANVFWIDVQTNTKQFQSIFYYLLENVALDQSRLTKLNIQAQRDLFLLLSRFMFFYNAVDQLEGFLNHFPAFPTSFLVGGPADIFVTELADQLQKLKVEPVLLHYLSQIKILQGLELRMTTSTRLKSCLYSFTPPGGPMYPTRTVRHAAWDALDSLFPEAFGFRNFLSLMLPFRVWEVCYCLSLYSFEALPSQVYLTFLSFCIIIFGLQIGQYPRHFISLFFRLLYPWYWPSSCWHFLVSCIKAMFYSLVGLIVSSWEKLRRPRMSEKDM